MMATFARISDGQITDVCYGESVEAATSDAFAEDYINGMGGVESWQPFDEGTQPGAKVTVDEKGGIIDIKKPDPVAQPAAVLHPGLNDIYAALSAIAEKMGIKLPQITGA